MNTVKEERVSFLKLTDLRTPLASNPPCLTIYLPLIRVERRVKLERLELREALRSLGERAAQFGQDGQKLLDSITKSQDSVLDEIEAEESRSKGAVIFKSAEVFQLAMLDCEMPLMARMARHFYIRPLLHQLSRDQTFYLLALSQKHTRLLYCTMHDCQEMRFPADIKTDYDSWIKLTTRHATESVSTDDGLRAEYLAHYYKQIDHGINMVLRGKTEPLVLCGVEYELPIYRQHNTYLHLCAEEVRGALNGLKADEMHSRAMDALERVYQERVDAALAEYNHRVGASASNRLKEVVPAAHDGRVLTLLLSDSMEQRGSFDESTHRVKGRDMGSSEDEDLLNDAAVQTVLHAGNVLVASSNKMPHGSPIAAIFRY